MVNTLDKIEQVVRFINENKRLVENKSKLEELEQKIDGLPVPFFSCKHSDLTFLLIENGFCQTDSQFAQRNEGAHTRERSV